MRIRFALPLLVYFFLSIYFILSVESKETMSARGVYKVVKAIEKAEGVGARVRRSIGVIGMRSFSPFLMFDHFKGGDEGGFPEHPHYGQETITLILKGAMAHEDFTGSKGILYPGDLQFMTAGRGIVHSEMPVRQDDGSPTEGLQLWVDLPAPLKDCAPRYRDLRAYEVPEATSSDGKVSVKVISGKSYGIESKKDLAYTPVVYYMFTVKLGGSFEQQVPKGFNAFLYVLNGDGLVVNGDTKLSAFDNCFFNTDGDVVSGQYVSKDPESEIQFILVAGESLEQDIVHYGPFVATSNQKIREVITDYSYARNGFENLKSWKTLISNGVTKDMINGELNGSLEEREKQKEEYLKQNKGTEKDEL